MFMRPGKTRFTADYEYYVAVVQSRACERITSDPPARPLDGQFDGFAVILVFS